MVMEQVVRASKKIETGTASSKGEVQQPAVVDAAAFLGMLQEASAPLLAAAAAASQVWSGTGAGQPGERRGLGRASDASEGSSSSTSGSAGGSTGKLSEASKGLRPVRTDRATGGTSSGGGSDAVAADGDSSLGNAAVAQHLLRQQLGPGGPSGSSSSCSGSGSPLFYPLHPRTTLHGTKEAGGSSSCGGTPHGSPMLLVPQTLPELLSARAALIRLMVSAHSFVQGPMYGHLAQQLEGMGDLYDSMHDDPVVVKRRKCREMTSMRDVVKKDTQFSQVKGLGC